MSLSTSERRQVAERWLHAAAGRLRIMVHVGHTSLPEAQALAQHAAQLGVDAIALIAPNFFKPQTVADLVDFCALVASAAPKLPFYYYEIPSMTGIHFPTAEFVRQAIARIPNFAGLKFSHSDLMSLQECLAVREGLDLYYGQDEMLLAALALGVQGAVGSTYNFAAPVYQRVITAFQAGDLATARREQRKSVEMIRVLLDFGVVRTVKAILRLMGIDCGTVRPPLRPVSPEEMTAIYHRLRHLDIFSRPLSLSAIGGSV